MGHRDPDSVTDDAGHCSFCGSTTGPFTNADSPEDGDSFGHALD